MRKLIIYTFILTSLCFASCNNWLDVKPGDSIVEDELFETESGYKQVLAGAYISMSTPELYGQNLLVAIPDAMAQYWDISLKTNNYYDVARYDFATETAENQLKSIWNGTYQIVVNLNVLIKRLESPSAQNFNDYKLIKGEALGLRAYLQLDLLRLFGPVLKEGGMEKLSIPYRTEYNNKILKRMTAKAVLEAAEKDLLEAYDLLKDDPIKKYGRKSAPKNYIDVQDMAYQFRGIRMNYYAVAGTLARVKMLKEEMPEAYKYAKEVIDANTAFQLLKRDDIIKEEGKRDLMFEREIIFGLYKSTLKATLGEFMGYADNYAAKLSVNTNLLTKVYVEEGSGQPEDYRRAFWWKIKLNETILNKYDRNDSGESQSPYDPLLPLMRLSEMYYIAAEASIDKDNAEAVNLLNAVRVSRNIAALNGAQMSPNQIREQLLAEQRKEFWGEGQMFYTYKRLFKNIPTLTGVIEAKNSIFELPIPKAEYEFGNN